MMCEIYVDTLFSLIEKLFSVLQNVFSLIEEVFAVMKLERITTKQKPYFDK